MVVRVDLGRRVFQLHWVEGETREIVSLQLKRSQLLAQFANRRRCPIAMESVEAPGFDLQNRPNVKLRVADIRTMAARARRCHLTP